MEPTAESEAHFKRHIYTTDIATMQTKLVFRTAHLILALLSFSLLSFRLLLSPNFTLSNVLCEKGVCGDIRVATNAGSTSSRFTHTTTESSLARWRRKGWAMPNASEYSSDMTRDLRRTGGGIHGGNQLVFIGIFCRREDFATRVLIRETMMQLVPQGVTVRFVICHPATQEVDPLLWAELRQTDDIHLLDGEENMNGGKSYQYFTTIRGTYPGYGFYAKADTDSYLLLPALATALGQVPPNIRFYGGRCNGVEQGIAYMSGSFYILSAQLVAMLEDCGRACVELSDGTEDMQTARMLLHVAGEAFSLGDLGPGHSVLKDRDPEPPELHAHLVYVHGLKAVEAWWSAHRQFVHSFNGTSLKALGKTNYWDGPYSAWWNP